MHVEVMAEKQFTLLAFMKIVLLKMNLLHLVIMLTLIVPFATCKVWVKKQLFSLVANISFTLIAYKEKCNRNGLPTTTLASVSEFSPRPNQ